MVWQIISRDQSHLTQNQINQEDALRKKVTYVMENRALKLKKPTVFCPTSFTKTWPLYLEENKYQRTRLDSRKMPECFASVMPKFLIVALIYNSCPNL